MPASGVPRDRAGIAGYMDLVEGGRRETFRLE